MGLFDWLFGQKEVPARTVPLQNPAVMPVLLDWLMSNFRQKEDGGWELMPQIQYPNELNPDMNQTLWPQVQQAISSMISAPPQVPQGYDYTRNFLNGGGYQLPPEAQGRLESLMATGGQGGQPTQQMREIATYGGVPGQALSAIEGMLQYGAPSQVGQYMSNAAQFGIPSEAGRPVHDRAMGIPTAATRFLEAYTSNKPNFTLPERRK